MARTDYDKSTERRADYDDSDPTEEPRSDRNWDHRDDPDYSRVPHKRTRRVMEYGGIDW
jgi:hypothetical protein